MSTSTDYLSYFLPSESSTYKRRIEALAMWFVIGGVFVLIFVRNMASRVIVAGTMTIAAIYMILRVRDWDPIPPKSTKSLSSLSPSSGKSLSPGSTNQKTQLQRTKIG